MSALRDGDPEPPPREEYELPSRMWRESLSRLHGTLGCPPLVRDEGGARRSNPDDAAPSLSRARQFKPRTRLSDSIVARLSFDKHFARTTQTILAYEAMAWRELGRMRAASANRGRALFKDRRTFVDYQLCDDIHAERHRAMESKAKASGQRMVLPPERRTTPPMRLPVYYLG
jgi:hypothetical protein